MDVDSLMSAMQGAFYTLIAFTLGGLIPFTYYGYVYAQTIKEKAPEGYRMPELGDMWIMLVSTTIWVIFDQTFNHFSMPVCRRLCKT